MSLVNSASASASASGPRRSHLRSGDSSHTLHAVRVAWCSATASPKSAAQAQPSQSVQRGSGLALDVVEGGALEVLCPTRLTPFVLMNLFKRRGPRYTAPEGGPPAGRPGATSSIRDRRGRRGGADRAAGARRAPGSLALGGRDPANAVQHLGAGRARAARVGRATCRYMCSAVATGLALDQLIAWYSQQPLISSQPRIRVSTSSSW